MGSVEVAADYGSWVYGDCGGFFAIWRCDGEVLRRCGRSYEEGRGAREAECFVHPRKAPDEFWVCGGVVAFGRGGVIGIDFFDDPVLDFGGCSGEE